MYGESAADDGARNVKFAQHEQDFNPEEDESVPRRSKMPLSLVVMACTSIGLLAMLCMPFGWHSADGGELQNYHLGLWQIDAAAYDNGTTPQDELHARCEKSERTIECGKHSMFKAGELGCMKPVSSNSSENKTAADGSSRRLMSAESFTEETWCGLWTQMQNASLVMLICGSCAVLLFWISICYSQSELAVSHPWSKVFLFCLPPVCSTVGILYYAITTFDFPSSCKDGADFCGLFVVYGFGPAFWASSIVTIFGFVPAIMAFAMMPDSTRDTEEWQNYGQDTFQPQYNQPYQTQQPYAGYPQDMARGLVQEGAADTEWRQTVRLHHEEMIVKRVKRGHCISCTIVFVALFMIVGLSLPFGWHTSNGGPTQKYYIGLWRIEVDPQNKDPDTGNDIAEPQLQENCHKKPMPHPQLSCGAHMIWDVVEQGCQSSDDDSDWCKLWTQVYTSSIVVFICGCISVLFFIVGMVAQCKFANGARSVKLVFLGLAPVIAIAGLVYYFVTTKELPDECTSAYSCNLLGFGPVFWGFALLAVYGLVPMFIVACTSSTPLASSWQAQDHGLEMGQREGAPAPIDPPLVACVPVQQQGIPMQAEFDEQLQQDPQQQEQENNAVLVESSEQTQEEEAPSAEPEPPAPEPPKESWEEMIARLAAAKKAKQEEEEAAKVAEEAAKAAEEPPVQPPVEEPQQKASIVPEINVSVAPVVKPEDDTSVPQEKCASCGAVWTPGAKFCNQCGLSQACSKCGNVLAPSAKFCNACGASRLATSSKLDAPPSPTGVPPGSSGGGGGGGRDRGKGLRGGRDRGKRENDGESSPRAPSPRARSPQPQEQKQPFRDETGHKSELAKVEPAKRDYALPVPQGNFGGFRQSNAPPKNFMDDDQPPAYPGAPLAPNGAFQSFDLPSPAEALRSGPGSRQPPSQLGFGSQQQGFAQPALPSPAEALKSGPGSRQPPAQLAFGNHQPPQLGFGSQQQGFGQPGLPTPAEALRNGPGSQQPQMSFGSQQQGFGGPGGQQQPSQLGFGSQQQGGVPNQNIPGGFQHQGGQQQQHSQNMYGQTPQPAASGDFGLSAPSDQSSSQPRQQPASWGFMPANAPGLAPAPQMPRTTPSPRDGYNQPGNSQPPQQPASWGYAPGGGQQFVARH